jgi:DNA end-binding protein Ku
MSISVQEPGFDGLARTNLRSPSKVVRKRGRRLGGACNEREIAVIPARPYWKGYLKLSLVTCPIALYTASSSTERVSFRQINKQTGKRLRQQLVDEVTREPVEGPDKGRGYEYAKNAYIPVEDDELDAIAIESNHTIEIDSFVLREQIDQRYLDSPFYVTPNDQAGQDAFAVIREAMRGKGLVALGRVVLAKRERVIMLEPWDKGLMGTTLRYPYEIRDAKEYFGDIPSVKVELDMLKLAEHILQTKAADFDPSQFVDRYEDAIVEMLRKKQAGIEVSRNRAVPQPPNLVNLTEALRRSVARENAASAASKKGHKRVQGQGEMLLPIAGKKSKEAPSKLAGRPSARRMNVG